MTNKTKKLNRKAILPTNNIDFTPPKINFSKIKANNSDDLYFGGNYKAPLSLEIQKNYNKLVQIVLHYDNLLLNDQVIKGTGGLVSVMDIIAYQIGWGKLVLSWYGAGIEGKILEMPGEGFNSWNYTALARHFYKKFQFENSFQQMQEFHDVVEKILEIVEREFKTENLDKEGVWDWCTLNSGKKWPLSKWIKVNTSSPYKKATNLIKSLSAKLFVGSIPGIVVNVHNLSIIQ